MNLLVTKDHAMDSIRAVSVDNKMYCAAARALTQAGYIGCKVHNRKVEDKQGRTFPFKGAALEYSLVSATASTQKIIVTVTGEQNQKNYPLSYNQEYVDRLMSLVPFILRIPDSWSGKI